MEYNEKEFEENLEKKIEEKFNCNYVKNTNNKSISNNNCIYALGIIGAAIFFITTATSFWAGVLGLLKAIVWPAFMVYELFNFLIK